MLCLQQQGNSAMKHTVVLAENFTASALAVNR